MSRRINKEKLNNDLYAIADKLRKTGLNSSLCNDLQLLAGKISEDIARINKDMHFVNIDRIIMATEVKKNESKPTEDVPDMPTPGEL
jgi:hypothetical protein